VIQPGEIRRIRPTSALRLYRVQLGLKMEDVAAEAGKSPKRVSQLERFPETASESDLAEIREACDRLADLRLRAATERPRIFLVVDNTKPQQGGLDGAHQPEFPKSP
jgi:transcriptional regulator with XRE-family HTH domain